MTLSELIDAYIQARMLTDAKVERQHWNYAMARHIPTWLMLECLPIWPHATLAEAKACEEFIRRVEG